MLRARYNEWFGCEELANKRGVGCLQLATEIWLSVESHLL